MVLLPNAATVAIVSAKATGGHAHTMVGCRAGYKKAPEDGFGSKGPPSILQDGYCRCQGVYAGTAENSVCVPHFHGLMTDTPPATDR